MKIKRIEFAVFTCIYLFVSLLIYKQTSSYNPENIWLYQAVTAIVFTAVIIFVFYISPKLFRKQKIDIGIGATVLLFMLTWLALGICFYEIDNDRTNLIDVFFESIALPIILITFFSLFAYEGLKTCLFFVLKNKQVVRVGINKESIMFLFAILLYMYSRYIDYEIAVFFLVFIPFTYCLYALHNYLLLDHLEEKKLNKVWYVIISIITAILIFVPFASVLRKLSNKWGNDIVLLLLGLLISILIIPLSYILYFNRKNQARQVVSLKKELGQTSADLKLLQSQINPHFLFNVMNTIYGIALQENAERTAEGIQKLGDMMRFMLHENQQDTIALSKEIAYLKEYLYLQGLRTSTTSTIQNTVDIQDVVDEYQIPPMLLIPFVENAFKHGISLNKPSWIRVQLSVDDGVLKFSVYNSIHKAHEHDPESTKSGIGLDNVKERLRLLYENKHQLNIEETQQEFFVFLTLDLNE